MSRIVNFVHGVAGFFTITALRVVLEPRRKRRVLWTLGNQTGWMSGLDVSRKADVHFAFFTLAVLEAERLVERHAEDPPEGQDRGFQHHLLYRLTDKGRNAAKRLRCVTG